ncbi:MAG: Rpn family recombination-promoting nuclease/putative transposase [Planctomycetota bacterium]|nr:Rpn family recombination-promoting nuclease/putative transposase [Planctomycetota bacterium]
MAKRFVKPLLPRNDFVFKRLMGGRANLRYLAKFLQSVLDLPEEEFKDISIIDPHLRRRFRGDKLCILDVRVRTRSGRVIDVEIQVDPVPGMFDRIQYYGSRLVSEQVGTGRDYANMPQAISIFILNFRLIESDGRYRHCFRLHDAEAGVGFPNSLEIHIFELKKLPKESDGTALWNWLKFFASERKPEFEALARKDALMAEVYGTLLELSADEKTRLLAESREKARRDYIARMRGSREEGLAKGMEKGLAKGRVEGEIESILRVLAARFGPVPKNIQRNVRSCSDLDALGSLSIHAATCETLSEFRERLMA